MNLKPMFRILGLANLMSCWVVLTLTFMAAYFGGDYSILVTINEYHEAHIELAMMLLLFPATIYTLFFMRSKL